MQSQKNHMEKRWIIIFKTLGNINRIRIIKMLINGDSISVTGIAEKLSISIKSTSRHLLILQNLDLLDSQGKGGFVFYYFNKNLPSDFKQAVKLIL